MLATGFIKFLVTPRNKSCSIMAGLKSEQPAWCHCRGKLQQPLSGESTSHNVLKRDRFTKYQQATMTWRERVQPSVPGSQQPGCQSLWLALSRQIFSCLLSAGVSAPEPPHGTNRCPNQLKHLHRALSLHFNSPRCELWCWKTWKRCK